MPGFENDDKEEVTGVGMGQSSTGFGGGYVGSATSAPGYSSSGNPDTSVTSSGSSSERSAPTATEQAASMVSGGSSNNSLEGGGSKSGGSDVMTEGAQVSMPLPRPRPQVEIRPAQTTDEVLAGQSALNIMGFQTPIDGKNGPKFRSATLAYQQDWNKRNPNDPIDEDGIMGWDPKELAETGPRLLREANDRVSGYERPPATDTAAGAVQPPSAQTPAFDAVLKASGVAGAGAASDAGLSGRLEQAGANNLYNAGETEGAAPVTRGSVDARRSRTAPSAPAPAAPPGATVTPGYGGAGAAFTPHILNLDTGVARGAGGGPAPPVSQAVAAAEAPAAGVEGISPALQQAIAATGIATPAISGGGGEAFTGVNADQSAGASTGGDVSYPTVQGRPPMNTLDAIRNELGVYEPPASAVPPPGGFKPATPQAQALFDAVAKDPVISRGYTGYLEGVDRKSNVGAGVQPQIFGDPTLRKSYSILGLPTLPKEQGRLPGVGADENVKPAGPEPVKGARPMGKTGVPVSDAASPAMQQAIQVASSDGYPANPYGITGNVDPHGLPYEAKPPEVRIYERRDPAVDYGTMAPSSKYMNKEEYRDFTKGWTGPDGKPISPEKSDEMFQGILDKSRLQGEDVMPDGETPTSDATPDSVLSGKHIAAVSDAERKAFAPALQGLLAHHAAQPPEAQAELENRALIVAHAASVVADIPKGEKRTAEWNNQLAALHHAGLVDDKAFDQMYDNPSDLAIGKALAMGDAVKTLRASRMGGQGSGVGVVPGTSGVPLDAGDVRLINRGDARKALAQGGTPARGIPPGQGRDMLTWDNPAMSGADPMEGSLQLNNLRDYPSRYYDEEYRPALATPDRDNAIRYDTPAF